MRTRQQRYMERALGHVKQVQQLDNDDFRDDYLQLCHDIPVLILNHGLYITACFLDSKAQQNPDSADHVMRDHLVELLGNRNQHLASMVGNTNAAVNHTATVLDAWVYYKRFAMSMLDNGKKG